MKKIPFGQFLTTHGKTPTAEADYNIVGDYSSVEEEFYIEAQGGEILEVEELKFIIEDNDPVSQNSWGADMSVSGFLMKVVIGGVEHDLTSGVRIDDWIALDRVFDLEVEFTGADYKRAQYNFRKKQGAPLELNPGDKLVFNFSGDYTGLASGGSQTIYASGQKTEVIAQGTSTSASRSVAIGSLNNTKLVSGERITVTGTAAANVEIANQKLDQRTILDFSNATITGYNIQVDNCENIVIHNPTVDMQAVSSNAIKVAGSTKIIIDKPNLTNGSNGIKLTDGTKETFVYQGQSHGATTDGMSCHEATTECGNYNVFHSCTASGGEQGFDITSGEHHSVINCRGGGSQFSLALGHNASAHIVNFKTPGYGLSIKECIFVNLSDIDVSQLRLQRQGSNNNPPENVKIYNPNPEPTINNPDGLTLADIYEVKKTNFAHPYQSFIDSTIQWIKDELR